jgi:hypothetical protein
MADGPGRLRKAVLGDDLGTGQGAGHRAETLWIDADRHGNDFTHIVDRACTVNQQVGEQHTPGFDNQRFTAIFEKSKSGIFEAFAGCGSATHFAPRFGFG